MFVSLTYSSCLYVIPKEYDPAYFDEGENLTEVVSSPNIIQNVVAQPLNAGGMLTFSHRVLHWGSPPLHRTVLDCDDDPLDIPKPRIALTFALADPTFEEPYFDHSLYLPFPPVSLRLGLVAGQQIQYEHLEPLDKYGVALYRRIFHSQKKYFGEAYFDKISSNVQFLAFQLAQRRR